MRSSRCCRMHRQANLWQLADMDGLQAISCGSSGDELCC